MIRDDQQPSLRPALSPILAIALGLWLGIALIFPQLRGVAAAPLIAGFWSAVAVGLGAIGVTVASLTLRRSRLRWRQWLAFGVLTIALAVACACATALGQSAAAQRLPQEAQAWTFTLMEDAKPSPYGVSARAIGVTDGTPPVQVELTFSGDFRALPLGTRLVARACPHAPAASSAAYLWQNGIEAQATLESYESSMAGGVAGWIWRFRAGIVERMREAGGNAAPLMEALACGYRRDLEESGAYASFQRSGLAHIVAVSGAHLTLVSMVVLALLIALHAPRALQIVIVSVFAALYWLLAGLAVSALRAAIMTVVALSAFGARRRAFPLNGLGLCMIGMLVIAPTTALSVSFGLSAGSTLGIILFTPLLMGWFAKAGDRVRNLVLSPLALTFSSMLVTQPASAAIFHQIPLIAPIANLIATPLFTLACLASLGAGLVVGILPQVGTLAIEIGALATMPLLLTAEGLGALPYAATAADLPLPLGIALSTVAALILWLWWPEPSRRLALGALSAVAALALGAVVVLLRPVGDEIIMLDVGQGDAFVVRSGRATIMIDTGRRDGDLKAALARHGIGHLDALFITHGDEDHCGSMDALSQVCGVDRVILADETLRCDCESCTDLVASAKTTCAAGPEGVRRGAVITVGRFRLRVISPDRFVDEGGNADSLTLVAETDEDDDGAPDWSALFCGDAEEEVLSGLVDQGLLGSVDILKVPHHGSKAGLSDELLAHLNPSVALISVGAENRYGHPSDEALRCLQAAGVQTWRSDQSGDVVVSLNAHSLSVTSQRGSSR